MQITYIAYDPKFLKEVQDQSDDPWMPTGVTLVSGDRLSVCAKGRVSPYSAEAVENPDFDVLRGGPEWCDPDGDYDFDLPGICRGLIATDIPHMALLGRIGSGDYFLIGSSYDDVVSTSASGELYICVNDCSPGNFFDNRGQFDVYIAVNAPGIPNHDGVCPLAHDVEPASDNPIKLRTGDKRVSETDLNIASATRSLTLRRMYAQEKQSTRQFMGAGWTHNHTYGLSINGTSPNRTATVDLPNGGALQLSESSANYFEAEPGSASILEEKVDHFVLTANDHSEYRFDKTSYLLDERVWPNGDVWSYQYTAGDLTKVVDSYDRGLEFAYYDSGAPAFKQDQLKSISAILDGSPIGMMVTYDYTESTLQTGLALLTKVTDIRGEEWTYTYSSNANTPNYLISRLSPNVDGQPITLESLSYTLNGQSLASIVQQRGNGLLQTQLDFHNSGNRTVETIAGLRRNHLFMGGVYFAEGMDGKLSSAPADFMKLSMQNVADNFRPIEQTDKNQNQTTLNWSSNGKLLNSIRGHLKNPFG